MRLRSRTPPRARRPSSGLIQNATPTIMPIVPTTTFLSNGRAMLALLTFPHARGHLIKLSRSANFTTSILDRIEQTIIAFRRSRSRHFPPVHNVSGSTRRTTSHPPIQGVPEMACAPCRNFFGNDLAILVSQRPGR